MANRLRLGSLFASLLFVFSFVAVDYADARRGGSFGSRGFRTYQSAPATRTAASAPGNSHRRASMDVRFMVTSQTAVFKPVGLGAVKGDRVGPQRTGSEKVVDGVHVVHVVVGADHPAHHG